MGVDPQKRCKESCGEFLALSLQTPDSHNSIRQYHVIPTVITSQNFSIRHSVRMDRKSRTARWKRQALSVDFADRKKDGAWRRRSGVILKGGRFQETQI